MEIIVHIVFSFCSTVAFALLINVPRSALIASGISGAAGWMVYYFSFATTNNLLVSYFVSALIMGLVSIVFSRLKKMPVTVFNIPGFVPLVPGGDAYRAIRYLFIQDLDLAGHHLARIVIIVSAIAFAFMIISVFEQLVRFMFRSNKQK